MMPEYSEPLCSAEYSNSISEYVRRFEMNCRLLIKELESAGITCLLNEPMSKHTSFHIGGPAAVMIMPRSGSELKTALSAARRMEVPAFIMGNGSNLLVSDDPLDMLVIKTFDSFSAIEITDNCIVAQSGALLSRVAVAAQQNGLTGLEFAHGIPGTVGGAVFMNAGAYGGEMKDVVAEAEYLDEELEYGIISGQSLGFSYRHSAFSDGKRVILSAKIKLKPGDRDEIREKMRELSAKRKKSQPLDIPSAGSTFKRPTIGYAAAMIDEAGLKGFSIGGAQVSEKHAGFVVNKGGASFSDVLRVMQAVRLRVYEKFGVELEPEIRIIRGGI